MTDIATVSLTEDCKAVFVAYAHDAGNWSGQPMIDGNVPSTTATRGHLTALKKQGLITTFRDEDNAQITWMSFTDRGVAYAASLGISICGHAIPKPEIRLVSHSQNLDEWMLRG